MSIMDNKKVDLVFIIDSSLSMKDEAEALCAKLESAIEEARKACPSDLRTDFLGIEGVFAGTKFNKTVRQFLTSEAGANPSALKGREYVKEGNPAQEDVAPAAEDVTRIIRSISFSPATGAEETNSNSRTSLSGVQKHGELYPSRQYVTLSNR